MSDIDFNFYGVPNRYPDVVQRMAVLYALRRPARTASEIREMTQSVLEQWRARIGALTSVGWLPSNGQQNHHSILYARNCKPTFALNSHRTRPCGNEVLCPFCYARWVRKIWMMVDDDVPAPSPTERSPTEIESGREHRVITIDDDADEDPPPISRRRSTEFRFHLVERHHYFYRPVLEPGNPDSLTIQQNLAILLADVERQRSVVIKMVDPVGAFLYTTVEPWDHGRQWKIHHRQLYKLLPTHDFAEAVVSATNGRVTRHERPTRRGIMQIVARICRYPTDLITGDIDRTADLLDVRRQSNFRGHAKFRSFRRMKHYD